MEQKRGGFGFAILAALGVGAVLLWPKSSKASETADPCKPLIEKANKILPTATATDLPALRELSAAAKALGCADLVTQVDKKIADLTKTTGGGGGKPPPVVTPTTQVIKIPSGVGPVSLAKMYGTTADKLAALNPSLVWGVIHEDLDGMRIQDCDLAPVTLPEGGVNPEYLLSTQWNKTWQISSDNQPIFKAATTRAIYKPSDGAGGINCGAAVYPSGTVFYSSGQWRFVRPWSVGQSIVVPNVKATVGASIAGDKSDSYDVSVEGCIACELPNPKDKFKEEVLVDGEEGPRFGSVPFGAIPFGGGNTKSYS